jgi:hypothetical protein
MLIGFTTLKMACALVVNTGDVGHAFTAANCWDPLVNDVFGQGMFSFNCLITHKINTSS